MRAPEALPPVDPAALGELAPLRVSVGAVANVPDMAEPVGVRGAAPLQPGGPIHLTEDAGTILRRTVTETLHDAGHRVVAQDAAAHVALRMEEFTVAAPREGLGWLVTVRVRLVLRVSARPGDQTWDELSADAERTLRTVWRPDIGTVEPVLRGCLQDLGALLARRRELSEALAKHSTRRPAG
ncbi:MAG: hypothetical protein JRH16_01225 [Deltaproteobacteria bacterium]|nr:hypothetical protein [Deltaproteobacteria bacterium]MBW2360888.1 hypothetical protein [Deltaproteobacteria bacterium]